MQKNKIEVSGGGGKTMYVPLSVFRNGNILTISYPGNAKDPENANDRFKFATSAEGLRKFAEKLEKLFTKYVRAGVVT